MADIMYLLIGISILIIAIAYSYAIIRGIHTIKKELDDLKNDEIIRELDRKNKELRKQL